jgi:hypothetical protein
MKRHLDVFKVRAESFRDSAMKRVETMPADAVQKIVTTSRGPIQNLAKSLAEFARKLEPEVKPAKVAPKATRVPVEAKPDKVEAKV